MRESSSSAPGIAAIEMRASAARIGAMRDFYSVALELETKTLENGSLRVVAGSTELSFVPVEQDDPFYHFAFNIPENQLESARRWLADRVPLLMDEHGSEVYHFESWNAHAIYFDDPAGNILELIARHNIKNSASRPFSGESILYASEIGVVVEDVHSAVRLATQTLGLPIFSGGGSDEFTAVGDEHQLLIVSRLGRPWNAGDGRVGGRFPLRASLRGGRRGVLDLARDGCEIVIRAS